MAKIKLHNRHHFPLDWDWKRVSSAIRSLFKERGYKVNSLEVILVDDEELLAMNNQFLAHDYYTDILTFNYANDPLEIEGELYISHTRVAENAAGYEVSTELELTRVVVHGALHLVGEEDGTDEEKSHMQALENQMIERIVSRETSAAQNV